MHTDIEKPTSIQIGDRIVGKKTGTLTPSTVVGYMPATYCINYDKHTKWDELYPDWRTKYIIYAEFDEPTKSLSFNEFLEQYELPEEDASDFINDMKRDNKYFHNFVKHQYSLITPTMRVCYPIDDIEVI